VTASPYAGKMPARVKMFDTGLNERLGAAKQHMNFAIECLGAHIPPGARILDFGCGIGTSVGALLADGYDPYGVDVLEYWDRDFDKYWFTADKPPAEIARRLKRVDLTHYKLPYDDGTFDFCFSDQVFEHVFDYATTMSEIARVLKPSAFSLHRFPGPNYWIEGHINLPFPWLCYSGSYLTFCAWLAALRDSGVDWRARVKAQKESMRFNNYPTKMRLRRIARSSGVHISFAETEEFLFRGGGRAAKLIAILCKIRMDGLAANAAGLVMQRYMILQGAGQSAAEGSVSILYAEEAGRIRIVI